MELLVTIIPDIWFVPITWMLRWTSRGKFVYCWPSYCWCIPKSRYNSGCIRYPM